MLYKNVVLSLALYVIWVHVNCIMFFCMVFLNKCKLMDNNRNVFVFFMLLPCLHQF